MDVIRSIFAKSSPLDNETLSYLQDLIDLARADHDLQVLPDLLMSQVISLLKPDVARYYVKDLRTGTYARVAAWPDDFWRQHKVRSLTNRRPSTGGAMGKAIQARQLVTIKDPIEAEKKGEYISIDTRIRNEFVLPVVAQESIVQREDVPAVIILSRYAGNEFNAFEEKLAKIVASITSAIYNNSLARARREKHIEFLNSITQSQAVNLDAAFQKFFAVLSDLVPCKFVSMWLYNELDDRLVIRSFYPLELNNKKVTLESFDSPVLTCSQSLSGEVLNSKAPRLFTGVNADHRFSNPAFAKKHDLTWFVSFPVMDLDKHPLGVVNLWPRGEPSDFTPPTLDVLQSYVSSIASIVQLASLLFEKSLLFAYDDFFRSMLEFQDQKGSWDELAELIRAQMQCGGCSIFLAERDGLLHLRGTTGLISNPSYSQVTYTPGEGLTGTAFMMEKPLVYYPEKTNEFANVHVSKHREPTKTTTGKSKSIIIAQIFDANAKCIGVIRCNNKEESPSRYGGRFTNEDVLQLQKIANVISNIHWKVGWLKEKENERERSLNSLHHEILAPIEGILSHIEWLERQFRRNTITSEGQNERIQLKISDMKQNAKIVDMVVTTMGRLDDDIQLNISEISIAELLEICKAFLSNEATRKGVQINIRYLGLPRVHGDALQLMRVFYNLLRNAIKYSDPAESARYLQISASEGVNDFELTFEDNGIGIVTGEEESIFDMFERGSNAARYFPEGSGLGLAYCRGIMKKHGGRIVVDPTHVAKPTVFRIRMPKRTKT